jgi:SRSO17 transposase
MECLVPVKRTRDASVHGRPLDAVALGSSFRSERGLAGLARLLVSFHARFHDFFMTRTRNVIEQSKNYLFGLIQSEKRNKERMAKVVPDSDDQAYQHFISHSPWSHRAVLDQVACDADHAFGDCEGCFLVVDESAIATKGKKSVGVARQWCGCLGKVDPADKRDHVGVFTALACGEETNQIDERL